MNAHPAASLQSTHRSPQSGNTGAQVEAKAPNQRAEIGAARKSSPVGKRVEPRTGEAAAPNLSTSIPRHLIATVRNNQLPTAELAARLGVTAEDIDAIRSLGHYSGGDLLESSRLIARDLRSEVVL